MKSSDTEDMATSRGRGGYIRTEKPKIEKKNMKLDFKYNERSGNDTIKAYGLCKSFEDKVIFNNIDLLISFGERAAMIGPNGSGKTTFLKMLLGEVSPDKGTAELGSNVKVGYLPQTISFNNEELTVLQTFRDDILILEGKAREYLSKFMFFGNTVFKKVKTLSGGERIRLKLAMLLYKDINLLILDEPTNHLDIDSIETFEEALEEFNGTIFFISHDRYFINKIAEKIVSVENQEFKIYTGNYDYYKEIQEKLKIKAEENKIEKSKKPKTTEENKKSKNQIKINEVKKANAEKIKLEARAHALEKEIEEIDLFMANPEIHYEELNKLYLKKEALVADLDRVMEMWVNC